MPYPEDVVRCHAVIQAWNIEVCHCVYANKTYTIERDDKQWAKDMAECRKFLDTEGFWKTPFRAIDPENSRKKNLKNYYGQVSPEKNAKVKLNTQISWQLSMKEMQFLILIFYNFESNS